MLVLHSLWNVEMYFDGKVYTYLWLLWDQQSCNFATTQFSTLKIISGHVEGNVSGINNWYKHLCVSKRIDRDFSSSLAIEMYGWPFFSVPFLQREYYRTSDTFVFQCWLIIVWVSGDVNMFDNYLLQNGRSPFHVAVENGSIDVVNALIRCGADIKALDWVRSMYIRYVLININ